MAPGPAHAPDERMSDYDRIMWVIEKNPQLRSTITAITMLDGAPARQRVVERVDRATRKVVRLRQRVVWNPYSIAPPRWEIDPNFDLDYHLRFTGLGGSGSLADVLTLTEPIAMQDFDRARPLWEFVFVDGLAGGASALITKLHHSITDGLGAIALMLELFSLTALTGDDGDNPPAPEPRVLNQLARLRDAAAHELRRQRDLMRQGLATLDHAREDPRDAAREAREIAASLVRLAATSASARSPLFAKRSLSVSLHARQVSLGALKAAAAAADVRLNDAYVVAVLNGVRRYHDAMSTPIHSVRMGMAVGARQASTAAAAGNRFLPVRFEVPIDIDDPHEHMRAVRDLVRSQRDEPALSLFEPLSSVVSRLPRFVLTGLMSTTLRGQDINISNVPGADFPVYFQGARVAAQYPIGPLAGSAVNTTLLSYLEHANIGINLDPAAVTEPELFLRCLDEGIEHVLAAVPKRRPRPRAARAR